MPENLSELPADISAGNLPEWPADFSRRKANPNDAELSGRSNSGLFRVNARMLAKLDTKIGQSVGLNGRAGYFMYYELNVVMENEVDLLSIHTHSVAYIISDKSKDNVE
ncbi:hypothetical protein IEQ34_013268 [Dendrobium chrysotoxum]|uniref:Uncharacterized protein n=1 Tax=Dendrobium chrysotoxum TaxID=161865 RepID=A0AAV7GQW7_DENCH|nr:hypothetical protein IEQ34_013268 [Dendrobium chrysotoxum]